MSKDKKAQEAIEETGKESAGGEHLPTAGPHAKDRLTDKSKTPGTGSLPDNDDESVVPGSG
ncbi:hypothetical protein AB4Z34_30680 [Ensifer sp. 2YAB10]|uniref:hypothetical protein n=1 Tax=unclassified Ensifer TaxID=2633371 RepID=UPI003F929F3D